MKKNQNWMWLIVPMVLVTTVLVLGAFKLSGYVDIHWGVVTAPLWIPIVIGIIMAGIVMLLMLGLALMFPKDLF